MSARLPRTLVAILFFCACRVLPLGSLPLLVHVATWGLLWACVGWVTEPLVRVLFFRDPLVARFASRLLGFLLWGWATWWPASLGFVTRTRLAIEIPLVLLALVSDRLISRTTEPSAKLNPREGIAFEFLFFGLFLAFVLLKSFTPEIFWGEKPMDFTFLNYFLREEGFPPKEPWAAGLPLHYYYFGPLLFSTPMKILGIPSSTGYLLALATLPSLLFSAGAAFLARAGISGMRALVYGSLFPILSGFTALFLATMGRPLGFDFFWSATRTFTSPTFAEFPLWAVSFGDLHAHVIALPFEVMAFSFLLRASDARMGALGFGFLAGAVAAINAWGAVILAAGSVLVLALRKSRILKELFPAALFALLAFGPAYTALRGGHGFSASLSFNEGSFNQFTHLALFFSPGLIGILLGAASSIREKYRFRVRSLWPLLVPIFCAAVEWKTSGGMVSGALFFSAVLAVAGILARDPVERSVLLAGMLWVGLSETFTFLDRMNTVFKTYDLLGVSVFFGGALGAFRALLSFPKSSRLILGATLAFSILASSLVTLSILRDQKIQGPRPTLDGTAYLKGSNPDEADLYRWMRGNIHGTPPIVEAFGDFYGPYARVAMHTGLPTFLGWDWHVYQRGVSQEEIMHRKQSIDRLYRSTNPEEQVLLLQQMGVQYVVLSKLEREKYGSQGLSSLENLPLVFPGSKIVFSQGETKLLEFSPSAAR